jgi:hypothetical protein
MFYSATSTTPTSKCWSFLKKFMNLKCLILQFSSYNEANKLVLNFPWNYRNFYKNFKSCNFRMFQATTTRVPLNSAACMQTRAININTVYFKTMCRMQTGSTTATALSTCRSNGMELLILNNQRVFTAWSNWINTIFSSATSNTGIHGNGYKNATGVWSLYSDTSVALPFMPTFWGAPRSANNVTCLWFIRGTDSTITAYENSCINNSPFFCEYVWNLRNSCFWIWKIRYNKILFF